MFKRCLLKLVEVEVHVLVGVENVRRLVQQVVQELGQQKSSSLVFFFGALHLFLNLQVILLKAFVLNLSSRKFLLDFFEFMLQKVDEVVILLGRYELLRVH